MGEKILSYLCLTPFPYLDNPNYKLFECWIETVLITDTNEIPKNSSGQTGNDFFEVMEAIYHNVGMIAKQDIRNNKISNNKKGFEQNSQVRN